jgi:hypothetical protein
MIFFIGDELFVFLSSSRSEDESSMRMTLLQFCSDSAGQYHTCIESAIDAKMQQ